MAIKFGDTLENQNTSYPIVDVVGDNIAGVHIVSAFDNTQLAAIPVNARRQGSIVINTADGKVYIFKGGTVTGNDNNSNAWGHAAGTNWVPAGSTTLGTPTDGDLTDGNPAIGSFTASTTIVDAIDLLNETLGSLVPTAPTDWNTFENGLAASAFGVQASANARLTPKDSSGNNITHATNNSGASYTAGSGSNTVNWETDTSINAEFSPGSVGSEGDNDLAPTVLTFRLNDESVTLASTSATSATLAANQNTHGGAITLAVTYGNFPTTGDSAGFYQGIDKVELDIGASLLQGFHKLTLEDASNNGISNTIYRAPSSTDISVTAVGVATDAGDNIYMSGQKFWTRPTYLPSAVAVQTIIPSSALVYGATSSATNNTFLTSTNGDIFPALASKSYTDISGVTSVDDLRLNQSVTFGNSDYSSVTAVAGTKGFKDLNGVSNSNVPKINGLSIHGNDLNNRVSAAGANYAFWDKGSVAQSLANLYPYEDNLYTDLHSTDNEGERVVDPDAITGTYVDNPSDAVSAYTLWSPQYGNNTSGSLSLDAQDAITCINSAGTSLECAHELRNFTSGYTFAASAQNFSGRTSGTAQYVTYRFPINGTSVATVYLKFQGDLDGGGDVFIKIFDGSGATNLEGANSSTGGWMPATLNGTSNGNVPVGGCASGTPLSKTATSLQTVALNAGGARWETGSDNFIYVRVKLKAGDYVRKIGLCATA